MTTPNQSPPTIPALKLAFLQHQLLVLSRPLRPSHAVLTTITTSSPPSLRQSSIDEALLKLNSQVKKHNKLVYPPEAQRHVAEQVWKLYWAAAERHTREAGWVEGEEWRDVGGDMCKAELIESLPETWDDVEEEDAGMDEAEREQRRTFQALQQKLKAINERREAARKKLERCEALRELLGPFEDAPVNVQGNLVTRDGDLERELEKMKMLLVRIERGIGGLGKRKRGEIGTEDSREVLEQENVNEQFWRLLNRA